MTNNMKKDIMDELSKEELETAIIMVTDDYYVSDENKKFPQEYINKPILLKDVINYFDYNFYSGFGEQECHSFFIWTTNKIFYIYEYDGSTMIDCIPRNPPLNN